jgi:hypothetical protein
VSTPTDPTPDGEPVDDRIALVTSVGPLDPVVALLRELLHVASAVRATAVVPPAGDEEPAVVDVARLAPIEVARGTHVVHLPHAAPKGEDAVPVPPLFGFKDLPIFEADPETGDIAAPLGGVEHRAIGVAETAALLPEGSVLQVAWDTTRAGVPFSITAQATDVGEPIVLGIGDEVFPMPAGWPDTPTLA